MTATRLMMTVAVRSARLSRVGNVWKTRRERAAVRGIRTVRVARMVRRGVRESGFRRVRMRSGVRQKIVRMRIRNVTALRIRVRLLSLVRMVLRVATVSGSVFV